MHRAWSTWSQADIVSRRWDTDVVSESILGGENGTRLSGGIMVQVRLKELGRDTQRLIEQARGEDIVVIDGAEPVARIISLDTVRIADAKSLFGILRPDTDRDQARQERLV
ncbi:MAG: hypothetical protein FWF02_01800 [Micrococcales bacterium]|nr:hypothetical protein [Micrococcales bacterium]MCL2666427.1 hypothetical protein [Micrococcales bacterium]